MHWLLVALFWANGGILSAIVLRESPVASSLRFYALGLVTTFLTLFPAGWAAFGGGLAAGHGGGLAGAAGGVLVAAAAITLGAVLHAPFLARAWGELILEARRRALGEHQLVVKKTYDQAEAAEKARQWERAAELYRAEIERDPEEVEARIRLAEVLLRMGRPAEGVPVLVLAYERAEEPEQKGPAGFRLAEICLELGRPDQAKEALERVREDLAGTRFEAFAKERLAGLK